VTEETLFDAALKLPNEQRAAFLDAACIGQPRLRAAVQALLVAHEGRDDVLDAASPSKPVRDPIGGATSTADYDRPEREGSFVAGRYRLLQQIGEGGMGSVWMAEQTEPVKRRVAVKLIRVERGASKTILARFEAERQAIALMDHPHIAKLLDAGATSSGAPFFVMELVKGVPLTDFCDQHKLTIPERLRLFMQICAAVQHAHQKGIIHRDLKPTNILVESHDGKAAPKVIDFGLAKATSGLKLTDQTLFTGFGAVMGTPLYMAPEQASFNAVDADTRADIYSLGIILYELLTGATPITREAMKQAQFDEMLRLIREQEAPTPSSRLSSSESTPSVAANRGIEPAKLTRLIKGDLDWIVMKALAKERDRRYETPTGFAKDIERFLTHEPVSAGPPTAAYRLRKFVRRHQGAVLGAAAFVFALAVGMIGTALGLVEARRQETFAKNAAVAEGAAKDEALKRLAQIEKGVEMFAGMLKGIDPRSEESGGEPLYVQLRKKAEQAALQLEAEAVGDPLSMARLQITMGNTLRELGSYPMSRTMLEKSLATREQQLGADDSATLVSMLELATTELELNNLPKATSLLEKVVRARTSQLGANHQDTLVAMSNLASAYRNAGRSDDSLKMTERVHDAMAAILGPDDPDTLKTANNLAIFYVDVGRLTDAIALFEKVRAARTKKLGVDHADTLNTLNALAASYQLVGRIPEAIPLYHEVLKAQEKKFGVEHPDVLITLNNLALALRSSGRLTEAIPLHERAVQGVAKLKFQHQFADLIVPAAIVAYESALQFDKAERWCRTWSMHVKAAAGPQSIRYAREQTMLGILLVKQRKWAEAEPILRESLESRLKAQPEEWSTFVTMSVLGESLFGQNKIAQAEPLLLKGYEGLKARAKVIPPGNPRTAEALDRLVEFYAATGKPDQAKRWRSEQAKTPSALPNK